MVLESVLKKVCKGTPVLMANNNFRISNAKSLAIAAAMPIVAVPIQEVQLLDYAVAHKTVNAGYGLTASTDDNIYLGLMDKDPYTSDQQRERDQYEINDTDWNEVVFEEVNGSSTAKLALHNDWISQKGYQVDAIVEMNLPEQGINGPFKITSIKHIIPQKKPVDDEADDYGYKPVTALFTHVSNQVYNISFDNGEEIGVTYQHPIFSVTAGDWKLAGELEVGEKVLSKEGEATVTSSSRKEGSETVYNLEVQELHNFLVGKAGVVVHNSCFTQYLAFIFKGTLNKYTRKNVANKNWVSYIVESGIPDTKEIKQLEKLGNKTFKRMVGLDKSPVNNTDFPGIDGLIEGGNPISLKRSNGTESTLRGELKKIATKANKLNKGEIAGHADYKDVLKNGIDGMMSSTTHSKNVIKSKWNSILGDQQIDSDIVKNLYVEASDGWLKWSKSNGWENF